MICIFSFQPIQYTYILPALLVAGCRYSSHLYIYLMMKPVYVWIMICYYNSKDLPSFLLIFACLLLFFIWLCCIYTDKDRNYELCSLLVFSILLGPASTLPIALVQVRSPLSVLLLIINPLACYQASYGGMEYKYKIRMYEYSRGQQRSRDTPPPAPHPDLGTFSDIHMLSTCGN